MLGGEGQGAGVPGEAVGWQEGCAACWVQAAPGRRGDWEGKAYNPLGKSTPEL